MDYDLEAEYEDRNGYPDDEMGYDEPDYDDDFPLSLEYPDEDPMFQHADGFGYNFPEEDGWGEL